MEPYTDEYYAIYLRKSREDLALEAQGEFETLRKHEQTLTEFAQRNNLKIKKIYRELVSGDTIEARPEMKQLLHDVSIGLYKGVLVTEISRLARGDSIDQGTVAKTFSNANTLIITPLHTYNPSSEADMDFFDFELFMARQEYKYIRRRMAAGKKRSLEDGKFINPIAPFGFDKVGKTLVPNEYADAVRYAFDMYANQNKSLRDVSDYLRLVSPDRSWHKITVAYMFRNYAYIGKAQINLRRKKTWTTETGEVKTTQSITNDPMVVDATWEGIVGEDLFYTARQKLKQNPPTSEKKLRFIFAGVLRCDICGRTMTLTVHKDDGKKYVSHQAALKSKNCPGRYKNNPPYDIVKKIIAESLEREAETLSAETSDKNKNEIVYVSGIKKAISSEYKKIEEMFDRLERGIYTEDDFVRRRQAAKEKIETMEKQLAEMLENKTKITTYEQRIIFCRDAARMIMDDSLPPIVVNQYLKKFIDRINYRKTKDELRFDIIFLN